MRTFDPNTVAADYRQLSAQAFQSANELSTLACGAPAALNRDIGRGVLNSLKGFLSHSQAADIANRFARRGNA